MNQYVKKGLRRVPLHFSAYAGITGTIAYCLATFLHEQHYVLICSVAGVIAAFLKEGIEQFPPVNQVWSEFWVDSLSQAAGALAGVWFAVLGLR